MQRWREAGGTGLAGFGTSHLNKEGELTYASSMSMPMARSYHSIRYADTLTRLKLF
jgi:hypothetical protein